MVLRTKGPAKLPKGYKLTMHISQGDAESVRVFRSKSSDANNSLCEWQPPYEADVLPCVCVVLTLRLFHQRVLLPQLRNSSLNTS